MAMVRLPWLVVVDRDTVRYAFPGATGTTFALRWTHSVEREDWEEYFQVQPDGSLMLVETRFKTFGAGVPDQVGRETRMQDGWIVMSGIERTVDPLHVQTASAENYRMRYGHRTLEFTDPGTPPILTFTTRDAALLAMMPALLRAWWRL